MPVFSLSSTNSWWHIAAVSILVIGAIAFGTWLIVTRRRLHSLRCPACRDWSFGRHGRVCTLCGFQRPSLEVLRHRGGTDSGSIEQKTFGCLLIVSGILVALYVLGSSRSRSLSELWFSMRSVSDQWFYAIAAALCLLAITIAFRAANASVRPVRRAALRCPECRYSMNGLDLLRCPECGYLAHARDAFAPRRPMLEVRVSRPLAISCCTIVASALMIFPTWRARGFIDPLPNAVVVMLERVIGVDTSTDLSSNIRRRLFAGRLSSRWQLSHVLKQNRAALRWRSRWPASIPMHILIPSSRRGGSVFEVTAPTEIPQANGGDPYPDSLIAIKPDVPIPVALIDGRLPISARVYSRDGVLATTTYLPITLVDGLERAMTPVDSPAMTDAFASTIRADLVNIADVSADSSTRAAAWRLSIRIGEGFVRQMSANIAAAIRVEFFDVQEPCRTLAESRVVLRLSDMGCTTWDPSCRSNLVGVDALFPIAGDQAVLARIADGSIDASTLRIRVRTDELAALTCFDASSYWRVDLCMPLDAVVQTVEAP